MSLPPLIQVFLAAMTPIGELRLSIPLGVAYGLPWGWVLAASLLGNMVPPLILVPGLERVARWITSFPNPAGTLLRWRTDKLRHAHSARFLRYGPVFLIVLVAVPLPMTGAWTGSLAAWVFRVPVRRAIPLIGVGVAIAGAVVTVLTLTGVRGAGLLL